MSAATGYSSRLAIKSFFCDQGETISRPNGYRTERVYVWREGYFNIFARSNWELFPLWQVIVSDSRPVASTGNRLRYNMTRDVFLRLYCHDDTAPDYRREELDLAAEALREDSLAAIMSVSTVPTLGLSRVRFIDDAYEPKHPSIAERIIAFEVDYMETLA